MAGRFATAKAVLLEHVETVIVELLGGDRRHKRGSTWNVVNPNRAKARASQMVVNTAGARRGGWIDFVSGDRGDVIDLVAFALAGHVTLETRKEAVSWTEQRFGIRRMDPGFRDDLARRSAARQAALEAEALEDARHSRRRVQKFFFGCSEALAGTPVEAYLASRGIPLGEVPNLARSFRYRADCEYWPLARTHGGKGPAGPAMVAAMVDFAGRLGACHLTFLERSGRKKRLPEGYNAKLFKGAVSGLMIRVTNGAHPLNPETAAYNGVFGPIGLTEGIEDALSAAFAYPGLRMWAAGSLSGLLHVPDHFCADGWLVFRDNDWGKPQAAALFRRAVARLERFGKPVEVVSMPAAWGKDVNEALNQEN